MFERNYEVGAVYVYNYGYSMTLYKFFRIERMTDKSIFIQEFHAEIVRAEDCFRPYVMPDFSRPKGKLIRKSITSYIGGLWDGAPRQEDHLD